jgi:hypothetical protein
LKVYNYNKDFIYTGITEALLDPIENKPLLPGYATFTAIPKYNNQEEFLVYEKEKDVWHVHYKCLIGTYFDKLNGNRLEIDTPFFIGDISSYTQTPPNLEIGDKTTIHYVNGKWKYNEVDITFLQRKKVALLKKETNKRIRSYQEDEHGNPIEVSQNIWLQKSQNFQDIKTTYLAEQSAISNGVEGVILTYKKEEYKYAKGVIDRKELHRKQYQQLKQKILQRMDTSELQEFDPVDEKYWKI